MKKILIILFFIIPVCSYAQLRGQLGILNITANSGINPATGLAWQVGDPYRLVFVSSTSRNATSTSIGDYNNHVQTAANAAGLGTVNWYAIASTSVANARSNTKTTTADTDGGVFLMDGSKVVAKNIADLWDGTVGTRINIDEKKKLNSVKTSIWTTWTAVWTGTASNGTIDGTRFLGSSIATIGLSEAELNFWIRRSTHDNNTVELPFYGISEVLTVQAALPVKLIHFEASLIENRKVQITWKTESENNNDYFTIEKSSDGVQWSEVSRISGAGNSNSPKSYNVYDYNPSKGSSYYRLKQTDFDRQFEYSDIKSFYYENSSLLFYPNPTDNQITINDSGLELNEFRLFNLLGQDITTTIIINKLSDNRVIFDLSELKVGSYLLKTKTTSSIIYKQ